MGGEPVRLFVKGQILGYKRSKANQYNHTALIKVCAFTRGGGISSGGCVCGARAAGRAGGAVVLACSSSVV